MSSRPKKHKLKQIPYLALLGIGLGIFYFFSGKASTKVVKQKLESISEQADESAEESAEAIIELKEVVSNSPSVILEGIKKQEAVEASKEVAEDEALFNQQLLRRWTDEEGNPITPAALPEDLEALISESRAERIIDIKKKTSRANMVKLISFDSTHSMDSSSLSNENDKQFFLDRWFNHKK